jgi:hypothetical protein
VTKSVASAHPIESDTAHPIRKPTQSPHLNPNCVLAVTGCAHPCHPYLFLAADAHHLPPHTPAAAAMSCT